jgi:tetratricopeptide (TPR) repeat protein
VKLFISYSRADAGNFARHIHKYFIDNGHAVFTDVNSITIGDPWARSIEKNISECDIFVVILTPDSLRSSHVEREVLQAQRENKIIVPCIHEYVNYNQIKWGLENIQGVEFSDRFDLALHLYPKIINYENKKLIDTNEKTIRIKDSQKERKIQDDVFTHSAQWYLDKAKDFEELRQYEKALEQYEKALEKEPGNFVARCNRDIVLEAIKKQRDNNNKNKNIKKALVIAVSDYNYLESIEFCKNDGQEMYIVLKKNGYDIPDNCRLIGYVDSQRLKNAIYDFFTNEYNKPDDTLVLYYSGYCVLNMWGSLFLAPSDMDSDQPFKSGFHFDDLINLMLACNSLRVVTILDIYFSRLQTSKGFTDIGGEEATTRIANNIFEKQSEKLKQGVGRCLLAASQGYEEAYDTQEKGHSIFTYYLLEGLKGHKNAVNDEGNVTFDILTHFIRRNIESLISKKRPKQSPIIKEEASSGEIVLTGYPELRKPKESNYSPLFGKENYYHHDK